MPDNTSMSVWKTKTCGTCGTSRQSEEQHYCWNCGEELPAKTWEKRAGGILSRAAIATILPVFIVANGLWETQGTPLMAECLASVFALTVLIVTWDLVAWMVRDCWKTRGVRIPLVLAVATGWWAFGILTVSFSEMEDPRTGETTKIGPGMLSPLPFIPLTNISREMEEQWDGGKNFTGWMTKMILAVYLPMGLAGDPAPGSTAGMGGHRRQKGGRNPLGQRRTRENQGTSLTGAYISG